MCGIIGYTGKNLALPILMEGLSALEYRGYDSAGVALSEKEGIATIRSEGRLDALEKKLLSAPSYSATCGIGHTRWATHGAPSDQNAHPHRVGCVTLVHNGIIENYAEIGAELSERGYTFSSDTDTERAAALLDLLYQKTGDRKRAIFSLCQALRGSYALGILFDDAPDELYAIRRDSPLIVAHTEEGSLLSSDVPALLPHTRRYCRMEENSLAILEKDRILCFNSALQPIALQTEEVSWDVEAAKKGGFPHFMLKEIHEEPEAIRKTLTSRIRQGLPSFEEELGDDGFLTSVRRIHMVACGTAMHACLVGKALIERYARLPVTVEIASEFRYRDPIIEKGDLVILLSQSGETADTLAALRHAKSKGVRTLAIVNVIGSSVAREADNVLYTRAGPEIAVASTKAYSVQCALLYLLAIRLGLLKGKLGAEEAREICRLLLHDTPRLVEKVLSLSDEIRQISRELCDAEHLFYIGRDLDSVLCTEASLKLKEISYIHSEAYAAGELKHGTISLITEGVPVISLITVSRICEKTVSGIREVKARGARLIAVTTEALNASFEIPAHRKILIPDADERILLFGATTALQLLAYHVSSEKGLDVDKPRNLAKSVTVE